MIPTISQVCSLNYTMQQDIEDYAACACNSIEIWLGKLETYLQENCTDDYVQLLKQHEMTAKVASYQGGLLTSTGEKRTEHWNHFLKRLELCQQLNIETLVVAADIAEPLDQSLLDLINRSLVKIAEHAQEHHIRIAVEFQSDATLMNNLQTALAMIYDLQQPNLGICLDMFHFYTGPSKEEDLVFLTNENLFHVQLCDLSGVARELANDADRILPGDGDIQHAPLIEHLTQIGYEGCVSVELMNPQIWQISPLSFGEIAMTALRQLLPQASMD